MVSNTQIQRGSIPFRIAVATLLIFLVIEGASALSNDGGGSWLYAKDITINNPGEALSDYQVMVTLNSSNFQFLQAQANGEDIRFKDAVGAELHYWIESFGSGNAKIWVNVPSVPMGITIIHIMYGNSAATSSSNESNVFIFADEFEGNTLKPHWTSLTSGEGSVTIDNGFAKLSQGNSDYFTTRIFGSSYNLPSNNIIFTTRKKVSSSFTEDEHILLEESTGAHFQIYSRTGYWDPQWHGCFGTSDIRCDWEMNVPLSTIVDTNFHVFDIAITNGKADFYLDNVYKNSITATLSGNLRPRFWTYGDANQYTLIDYVRVRKYTTPEPSVSVGGGLVAEYHFDGNAQDTSGNANHGTLMHGASFGNGISGEALSLDGVDDYANVPDSVSLKPSSVTVESWINLKSFPTDDAFWFVEKGDSNSAPGVSYGIGARVPAVKRFHNGIGTTDHEWNWIDGTTIYDLNTWYHLAMTYDESILKIYVNGNYENSLPINKNIWYNTGPLQIGKYLNRYVNGFVDEVRIYNRALSADEIKADYERLVPPTVSSISVSPSPATVSVGSTQTFEARDQHNNLITVDWSSSDESVGTVSPATGTSTTFTAQRAGATTVRATSGSVAGSASVTVPDEIAPVTLISLSGTAGNNGWYTGDITVNLTAEDNEGGSGVALMEYTLDGTTWSSYSDPFVIQSEGTTTIRFRSVDNAGNIEQTKNQEVKFDKTAPAIDGAPTTAANANGWYNGEVTVRFTCEDGTSGPVDSFFDVFFPLEGENLATDGKCIDNAGNEAVKTVSGINIDKTAPTITGSRTPAASANGWNSGDVTVHFDCTDGSSGVESCTADTVVSSEGTGQSVTGTVTDKAGNSASASVGSINIDKTAPLISINTPVAYGLYTVGTALSFTASDERSSLDGDVIGLLTDTNEVTKRIYTNFVPLPGVYTLIVEATDKAGNTAQSDQRFFVVYDPAGGFATGGGWLIPDIDSTLPGGRANFGFVAKYKNDVSTGNLEFQYMDAQINLKSTSIDWLVISDVSAQFQGTATINGEGQYTFRVNAKDNAEPGAGADSFDIRIWQGTGIDTLPMHKAKNVISGGNIVVHKK